MKKVLKVIFVIISLYSLFFNFYFYNWICDLLNKDVSNLTDNNIISSGNIKTTYSILTKELVLPAIIQIIVLLLISNVAELELIQTLVNENIRLHNIIEDTFDGYYW